MTEKKKWWATTGAGLRLLAREEVDDCLVWALGRNNEAGNEVAQATLGEIVKSHPDKITGTHICALVMGAALDDDPRTREYAKQQVVEVLRARGAAEPELVERVLNHARIIAEGNKEPEFRKAAQTLAGEVEGMFPVRPRPRAMPPSLGQRVRTLLHLSR